MVYPVLSRFPLCIALFFVLIGCSNALSAQCGTIVQIEPYNQVFCNAPGSTVTLSALPVGGVFTGEAIRGDGFLALDKLDAGSYWMYYTADDLCETRDSVELQVQHVASEISQLNPYDCSDTRSSFLQVVATSEETLLMEGLDWTLNVQPEEFETYAMEHANTYSLEVLNTASGQTCVSEVQPAFNNPIQVRTRTNIDCQADSISIMVTGIELPTETMWKHFDDFAFAKTGPIDTGLQLSPSQIGEHELTAIYANGCISKKDVSVPLIDSLVPRVTLPTRVLIPCSNEAFRLPCQVTAGQENGQPYINWVSDSGEGIDDPTIESPVVDRIGNYTLHVTDSTSGCTLAPLSIRVDQAGPQQDTFYQVICNDSFYDWEGIRHRESGVYDRSFQNFYECDSNRVLVLEVLAEAIDTVYMNTCAGSYVVFGADSLRTTGFYTKTFSSARGCDSTVSLQLEVDPATSNSVAQSICAGEQFFLGGEAFTESGQYSRTLQNASGCDSAVELTLEVLPVIEVNLNSVICEGDSYTFGNQVLFTGGEYTDIFTDQSGCDSTVSLTLEVISTSNTDLVATICEGEAYELSGQSFTRTGLYSLVFGAANGCDSIFNLDLTVTPSMILSLDTITRSGSNARDVVVRVEGGTPPYRFQWSNGAVDDNVPVGTAITTVEVFDASGCEQVLFVQGVSGLAPEWAQNLSVGPNPTNGTFQWSLQTNADLSEVVLRNAQGQTLERKQLISQTQGQLELTSFPAGLYLVEFSEASGQSHTMRVVKL